MFKVIASAVMVIAFFIVSQTHMKFALAADVTAGIDYASSYVWRGVTFNEDSVLQPSVDVTHPSGLAVNVWGNLDLGDWDGALDEGEFSEVDITFSYVVPVDFMDLSAGFIFYLFPQGSSDAETEEFYVSAGYSINEALSVAADVYFDIDAVAGIYTNVSAALDLGQVGLELPEPFSLELGLGFGFVDEDFAEAYGGTDSGAFDFNVSLSGAYTVNDATEISFFVAYTDNMDSDTLPDQDVDLYAGAGLSHTF